MASQRSMFGEIVERTVTVGSRQWYSIPLSIGIHGVALLGVIIVPLMAYDVLPTPSSAMESFRVVALPPPPPLPAPRVTPKLVAAVNPDSAPVVEPQVMTENPPESSFEVGIDVAPASIGVLEGSGDVLPPPSPVPPAPTPILAPIRVGGEIKRPVKTKDVAPQYPPIAVISRVEGLVIIEATIAVDGTVEHARVLRSIPLLDAAAIAAVTQWEFTPTLLNGVPVPIIMTVTVQFTLAP